VTISPGFRGRRRDDHGGRLPPGQHLVSDFPVLTVGPTPRVPLEEWTFSVIGAVDAGREWNWQQFQALPAEDITVDIHCVTTWSKFDTTWRGVSVDTLLAGTDPQGTHVMAECDGGYTTNLPLADVTGGKAWVAYRYDGASLAAAHGGPARLLVPHLYFWKSAKWVRRLRVMTGDAPGFWEERGYNMYGDPFLEQRYWGD
jgi:DMSO/TMAO reductase YedYZ molybdopterin-dependent catalytic subunit